MVKEPFGPIGVGHDISAMSVSWTRRYGLCLVLRHIRIRAGLRVAGSW